jgi:1-acyl-sn-glycerol-3-phosphate acyltransferase
MSGATTEPVAKRGSDLTSGTWPSLYAVARWIGSWLFDLPFRRRVHGGDRVPPAGPVVLVANHSAFVDGPLLFGVLGTLGRRPVFLVKSEMFAGPVGWALRRIAQIPVNRGVPDRAALTAAQQVLRGGGLVGVFPEGTRSTADMRTAHHGAAWLARSTDATVLPIVVRGTRRPDGVTRRRWRPRVDVLIGHPFSVERSKGRAGLAAATEQVRGALVALIGEVDELRSTR